MRYVRMSPEYAKVAMDALSDLTMDPPGAWSEDPELEAKLAKFREVRDFLDKKLRSRGIS